MERDARRRLSTANATYVSPSATKKLRLGAKIGYLFTLNVSKPYFLQRLTDRTHFFNGGFYTTAFYVGDEGVLLLDVPEKQGAKVLQAIAEVTTLPMTAIVYSHNHADHIIDTPVILDASSVAGVKGVPPNETVEWPNGSFQFERLTVRLTGFTHAAHCDDAGVRLLAEEKVVHHPDLVKGDQPPFWNFGTAENYLWYRSNVNELGALDWIYLVGGNGNVGSKNDIRFYNAFLDDFDAAVGSAMAKVKFADVAEMKEYNNHTTLMIPWMDAITARTTDELRPKYGKYYAFEISTQANAKMVALSIVSYHDSLRLLSSK